MHLFVRARCFAGGVIGLLLCASVFGALRAQAQGGTQLNADLYRVTYRPPSAEYRTVPGPHFGLIVQEGGRRSESSVGGGIGLQLRLFYVLDVDVQLGAALRLEPGDVERVWR